MVARGASALPLQGAVQSSDAGAAEPAAGVVGSCAGLTKGLWIVGWSRYEPAGKGGSLLPAVLAGGAVLLFEAGSCGVMSGGAATDEPMLLHALPFWVVAGVVNTLRSAIAMGVAESFQVGADGVVGDTVGHDGGGPTLPCDDELVVGAAGAVTQGFDDCDELAFVLNAG
jgi:hypothetical protein